MSNKKQKPKSSPQVKKAVSPDYPKWLPWGLVILGILVYANTLGHQWALDDYSVIKDNFITKRGLAGISQLLTTDYRYGYWTSPGTLYRPLSLVLFAIEWQLSPDNPMFFHLVNILLYGLTIYMIFKFLNLCLGRDQIWITVASTLIFAVHPVHTEVVSNIKSADEILGMLGGISALYFYMKYLKEKKSPALIYALAFYFIAVFSKESAITFLAIFPLTAIFFGNRSLKSAIVSSLPFLGPVIIFLLARQGVVGGNISLEQTSVLDNFLVGIKDPASRFASAMLMLGYYFLALVIPIKQVHEMGFNQIPTTSFGNWQVLLSLALHIAMVVHIIKFWKQKDLASYGFAFYFIGLSIVSNIIITIGTSYGERLLYMPGLGLILAFTFLAFRTFKYFKVNVERFSLTNPIVLVFGIVSLLFAFKTIARNPAWFDSYTLYKTDIELSPKSAKMRYHYALETGKLALKETDPAKQNEYRKQAIAEDEKAISVYPNYFDAYAHKGLMYYALKDYPKALENYTKAVELGDNDPKTFSNMGTLYSDMGRTDLAIENYKKAVKYDPRFVDARRNLGCMHARAGDFKTAIQEFQEALKYDPQNADVLFFMGMAYKDSGDPVNGQAYLDRAYALKPELKR